MSVPSRTVVTGLAALSCGALVPLGFAPWSFYPLPVLTLALLIALLRGTEDLRRAFLLGWLFGLGQFTVGISWVHISIHHYGNAGLALSLASMFLLAMYLALFPALMAWIMARCGRARPGWYALAVFPGAWVLTEWLRSWLFTGFPWLNLGYSQIDSPLAAYAPLAGVYGVSLVTATTAGALFLLVRASGSARRGALLVLAAVSAAAIGLEAVHWTQPAGEPIRATLIQGNIAQELKWKPELQRATLERYIEMTREHLDSDLVVWPETAVPAFYDEVDEAFLEPLRQQLAADGLSLVTGIPVLERDQWNYYNAVISLNQPGAFYYKVHLVPFGEYLPLRDWLASLLSFLPIPQADFSAGTLQQSLLRAAGYPVGASICYEIAFGEELIHALPEAALLINVSNDAWFGDSLAPHQHQEMARMRARETGRYILRATNTGISAIIDYRGRIVEQSPQFVAAAVSANVVPRHGATPYVRSGNWPVVILSLMLLLSACATIRRAPASAAA